MPPLYALYSVVTTRQRKFFRKMWRERQDMVDDPLSHAIRVLHTNSTVTSRCIFDLIHDDVDDIQSAMDNLKTNLHVALSPKVQIYFTLNPD